MQKRLIIQKDYITIFQKVNSNLQFFRHIPHPFLVKKQQILTFLLFYNKYVEKRHNMWYSMREYNYIA